MLLWPCPTRRVRSRAAKACKRGVPAHPNPIIPTSLRYICCSPVAVQTRNNPVIFLHVRSTTLQSTQASAYRATPTSFAAVIQKAEDASPSLSGASSVLGQLIEDLVDQTRLERIRPTE